MRKVSPIKINDLVKIHGQRNKYIVKSVKPHLDNKHKLQFMFDLLQEDCDVNYKYNVGTCQITKIK